MARYVSIHRSKQQLNINDEQKRRLIEYLSTTLEDSFSARMPLEKLWRLLLRQYEGVPNNPVRNTPVENAPNIEVTLGAIASDAIYAQIIDLIYSTNPFIICRPIPKDTTDQEAVKDAKAFQRWTNWFTINELNVKEDSDDAVLDNVQLGTGWLYCPWAEKIKKTKTAKVLSKGPKIRSIPIEDVIVLGGTHGTVDEIPGVGIRFWLTREEMQERASRNKKWNLEGVSSASSKDWVRTRREALSRNVEGAALKGNLYEIFDIYCYFDIDGDGINEDLYCVFDRTSKTLIMVEYNPYDSRPLVKMVYQKRPHIVHGMGVMEMVSPYQEELTELHNYQTLNTLLANCRLWKGRTGRIPENMRIWPNKVLSLMNPSEDLVSEQMADIYSSLPALQNVVIQLAERRVGVNEMSVPNKSAVMGNRTPGITAISMLQQVNKRFAPAFEGVRRAIAESVRQCLYRYQERLLSGDTKLMSHIASVLGTEDGYRVIRLLKTSKFDEHISVELAAASASVNRESDRQNAILLVNILAQYYDKVIQLVGIAANPETPHVVADVAKKIGNAAGEIIDRTIRAFDQVRDPSSFIIEIDEEIDRATKGTPQTAIDALLQMMSSSGGETPAVPMPESGGM